MTLEDRVQAQRLYALRRADELGNVSAACRELGISRTHFYELRKRFERYGPDGLHPRRRRARPGRPPALPLHVERVVIGLALASPTWGPQRIATQLVRQGFELSASTVYRALKRAGLGTRRERLLILERHSAQSAGLLTDRTRRKIQAIRAQGRHIEAEEPGELVCLDTFYVGKLKGVGRVWQITACDAACSYAVATLTTAHTAEACARFLRKVLLPLYREAGWDLQRVLTDGGSEFKGAFSKACEELGIRQTKIKPRHPWTNGFVERLQGTILHEHWRVEFRRRYFTRVSQLSRSLEGYLRFYNDERPHHGYRLRGRTPSELFWGGQR